jgi:hypothetical protein
MRRTKQAEHVQLCWRSNVKCDIIIIIKNNSERVHNRHLINCNVHGDRNCSQYTHGMDVQRLVISQNHKTTKLVIRLTG